MFSTFSFLQIEMMSESIDETLDKDEAEEETEELTNQVNFYNIFKVASLDRNSYHIPEFYQLEYSYFVIFYRCLMRSV